MACRVSAKQIKGKVGKKDHPWLRLAKPRVVLDDQ